MYGLMSPGFDFREMSGLRWLTTSIIQYFVNLSLKNISKKVDGVFMGIIVSTEPHTQGFLSTKPCEQD